MTSESVYPDYVLAEVAQFYKFYCKYRRNIMFHDDGSILVFGEFLGHQKENAQKMAGICGVLKAITNRDLRRLLEIDDLEVVEKRCLEFLAKEGGVPQ